MQEQLDNHAKDRAKDGEDKAVRHTQDFEAFSCRQHLAEGDPGNGEHKANLYVQAN
jgi:hypothetical protein